MAGIIDVIEDRCVGCSACIRVCPSPEANIVKTLDDGRVTVTVDENKCIACGNCVKACKPGARDYNDDIDRFFSDSRDRKILLIVHPAIKSAFPGTWQAVLKWFKQNGAAGVYDGANGADVCTWAYVHAFEQGAAKNVVSQHCPAVVSYIETYHPSNANNISPVHGPICCEAIYIRDYLKLNYAVAALTPCPAMKKEFEATGYVQYNITFKSLKDYFRRKKIDFSKSVSNDQRYDFDDSVQGCMGGIYSAPDGLRYNLTINMPELIAVSADGSRVYKEIEELYAAPPFRHPQMYDMLSCEGGCGMGCGCPGRDDEQTVMDVRKIWREVEIDAKKRRKVNLNGTDKLFKRFDDILNPKSFLRSYKSNGKVTPRPNDKELEPIFALMGKTSGMDKRIDCGACGYKSCREMAEAVYAERNVPEGCIMFAKKMGVSKPAVSGDNQKAAEISEKVSGFATNLLADIENIYASLSTIDDANQQSSGRAKIVEDILEKIVGFCASSESIESDNLTMLTSTLEKLQYAVSSLHTNVDESVASSSMIREAVKEVADATTELNIMAHEMVSALSDKY